MNARVAAPDGAPQLSHELESRPADSDTLVLQTIERWREGTQPDARTFLENHADIDWQKSQILDLAYEEYCLLVDGTKPEAVEQFLNKYGIYRRSLRRQIEVHEFLERSPTIREVGETSTWPEVGMQERDLLVVEELGRGSFARAYICEQRGLGERQVVVKFAVGGAFEADMMGKLSHHGIMPVHSVQHVAGSDLSAICMPFRGRSTLCDVIDMAHTGASFPIKSHLIQLAADRWRKPSDTYDNEEAIDQSEGSYVEGVVRLGIQMAEALQHANNRGIVHGDLKPSNILVTPTGRPQILDFNLSTDQSRSPSLGGGTLPYMSPEQIRTILGAAEADGLGPKSDIFSLGVVLYELLSGELPFGSRFSGRNVLEAGEDLLKRQSSGAIPLRSRHPQINSAVAKSIEQCLHFEACDRPADMAELAANLRRCFAPHNRVHHWIETHRLAAIASTSVLAFAAIALTLTLILRPPLPLRLQTAAFSELRSGDYAQSLILLDQLLAMNSNNSDALHLRGVALMKMGRYDAARTSFYDAYKLDGDARHCVGSGYCLAELRRFDEALYEYTVAQKNGHASVSDINNLAYCLRQKQQYAKARQLLDRAVELDGHCVEVFWNRAAIELQLSNQSPDYFPKQGADDIEKVVKLTPANSHVIWLAVQLFAAASRHDEQYTDKALSFIEMACGHGHLGDKNALDQDPSFDHLRHIQRFSHAVEREQVQSSDVKPSFLIEPEY